MTRTKRAPHTPSWRGTVSPSCWTGRARFLVIARAEGVDRALVICDEANVASATVIQRVGGRLEDVRLGADGTTPIARYWIA